MSYILDALKKSEQERGSGNIPSVQTVHSSSLNYNNKKTYWPYFLIIAVSLNFLVIVYFMFNQKDTPATETVVASDKNTANDEANTPAVSNIIVQKEHVPVTTNAIEPVSSENPAQDSQQPSKTKTALPPASSNNIIEFYDLADSVRNNLPSIVISAHVYSTNPLQRSIVINNKFLEEGEYVLDDLVLYEITRDGAVFSYHDIMFHHGVISTWQ